MQRRAAILRCISPLLALSGHRFVRCKSGHATNRSVDYLEKSLAHNTTGRSAWTFSSKNLRECSLFNYFAQPHELIYALIWPHITPTFKMVHRRGADRAQNYIAPIEHRELNDRPIEVVTPDLALLQRHCEYSISEGFDCATSIGRCRFSSAETIS